MLKRLVRSPLFAIFTLLWMTSSSIMAIKEMDEGQQWVTYRACRNVYIFFTIGIPLGIFICAFGILIPSKSMLLPVTVLFMLGLGQIITYWVTTRKYSVK